MHEARAVLSVLADRFDGVDGTGIPDRLWLVINDPVRASPDPVRLYAEAFLQDHGIEQPHVTVTVAPIECPVCGARARPTMHDPVCGACGMPFVARQGPVISIEAG
jgi:hypothetical protein